MKATLRCDRWRWSARDAESESKIRIVGTGVGTVGYRAGNGGLRTFMLFTIDDTTDYLFTRPVYFEPHQLRFCPRSDGSQRVVRFDLQIDPTPDGITQSLDAFGNLVTVAWFGDLHDHMVIRATSEVE